MDTRKLRLRNEIALVTGAGSGIGKATALALAKEGAKVAILELIECKGEAVAAKIKEEGGNAIAIKTDINKIEEIDLNVKKIRKRFGFIDILINNAGLLGFEKEPPFWGPVQDIPNENFERMVKTNFLGAVAVTKAVLPSMIERKSGTIVNVASWFAWPEWTNAGAAPYDASKWALWAFSRCLRQEVHKYNIRVVTIHPGSTATGDDPEYEQVRKKGRLLTAEDIADIIVYAVTVPQRVEIKDILITHSQE